MKAAKAGPGASCRAVLVLILPLLLLLCAPVRAETVRFAEEAGWPPFTPDREGRVAQGLSHALVERVFAELGADVTLDLMPMRRVLFALEQGTHDGVTVISRSAEREGFIRFSVPILRKRGLVYYDSARMPGFAWTDYRDFEGLIVATVAGHNYGDAFTKAVARHGLIVTPARRQEPAFRLLATGRADLVLSVEMSARAILPDLLNGDTIRAATRPYFSQDYHIGIAKASPWAARMGEIDSAIRRLKRSGVIEDLIARHAAVE